MKKIFGSLVLMLMLGQNVTAAQFLGQFVNLNFDQVPLLVFLRGTYGDLLDQDYVLDPSVRNATEKVTLKMRDVEVEKLRYVVDSVIKNAGIEIGNLNGRLYFYARGSTPAALDAPPPVTPSNSDDNALFPAVPASVLQAAFHTAPGTSDLPDILGSRSVTLPEVVEFYEPRYRVPEQLQTIANALLGTASMSLPDRVVLAGSKDAVSRVMGLITQYDGVPGEVSARALVFEFSESTDKKSGFQIAALALAEKLQIGINTVLQPLSNVIRWKGRDLSAILTAVSGDSRFSLVSAPSIRVVDGAQGHMSVGQEVPVLASTELDRDGRAIQSVQYRSSGVLFDVSPRIMRDRIQVKLSQQISSFQQTSTSQIDSPTLQKREVSTTVSMSDGEIIILGGLDETKTESSSSGLWFLPRFLNSNSDRNEKSQILVVLQISRVS